MSTPALRRLALLFALSGVTALGNPNGIGAIAAMQVELNGPFMAVVDEFFPLWKYATLYQAPYLFYGAVAVAVFGAVFMLRAWRHVQPAHALLFIIFVIAGLKTFRFSFLLVFMALALAAPYYRDFSHAAMARARYGVLVLLALALCTLAWVDLQRSALRIGPLETAHLPQQAAHFVRANNIPGPIFNVFEYGGYLEWMLYPQHRLFIDQRNLDYDTYARYSAAWRGNYHETFRRYGINSVVFYLRQPVLNRTAPIIQSLLTDPYWDPVYVDDTAIVLIRKTHNPNLPVYDPARILDLILR